jgi:hypothetical protein
VAPSAVLTAAPWAVFTAAPWAVEEERAARDSSHAAAGGRRSAELVAHLRSLELTDFLVDVDVAAQRWRWRHVAAALAAGVASEARRAGASTGP